MTSLQQVRASRVAVGYKTVCDSLMSGATDTDYVSRHDDFNPFGNALTKEPLCTRCDELYIY